ncbi:DNA adenine methylase [Chitinimonas koreensis]|uniref:DNA adenine methylase n=1 Tax=Chitinimonas koreensis TaxID=356302 RepID=UPI0004010FA6|nr:DNA adenine methylase [Chitinimonas koreensis]QNM94887.1 DNA adenine methylase [Chitinimonas koreensis]
MQQATPIIPWLGGKSRLADKLIPLFPDHQCYVEPFAGGAALFFNKPYRAQSEVLNDINRDLVTLYRCVQHHLDEFVRQFKWLLTSRETFETLQATRPETLTDIQRAARFFYLQHNAFGGRVAGQTFGTATTQPGWSITRVEEQLSAAWYRLAGVYIEHLPWQEVVRRYDRPHTFVYADPPYWRTEGYGVDFPFDHYVEMAALMRDMQGRMMVSINDHPDIRAAFEEHHVLELEIKYSCGRASGDRPVSGELVITNWDPAADAGLFG